jgi:GT2 family glycosyltransferase
VRARIGIVAIGRNEGERLRKCLASAIGRAQTVVYVDSGSTDGSPQMAREMGAAVVDLDLSIPFTAARARNEGFEKVLSLDPATTFVQFVDGDCEIADPWIERAAAELAGDEKLAVVCGRRRERHPESSVYNKLCDIEWNTPIGDAKACGGDAMMRVSAFRQVGGFDASVIAGEEPELCVRLRRAGWFIRRVDAEMTLHDAAMTRFSQWWKRNVRAGHAYAQGAAMHGAPPERHWVREVRSNYTWGFMAPAWAIILAPITFGGTLLLLFALWFVQRIRIARGARARGMNAADADLYAKYIVLGKIPNAIGQLKYVFAKAAGRRSRIIEYKTAATPAARTVPE